MGGLRLRRRVAVLVAGVMAGGVSWALTEAGWGWKGSHATGQDVFRLVIGNKNAPIHWHLDIWEVGRALFR